VSATATATANCTPPHTHHHVTSCAAPPFQSCALLLSAGGDDAALVAHTTNTDVIKQEYDDAVTLPAAVLLKNHDEQRMVAPSTDGGTLAGWTMKHAAPYAYSYNSARHVKLLTSQTMRMLVLTDAEADYGVELAETLSAVGKTVREQNKRGLGVASMDSSHASFQHTRKYFQLEDMELPQVVIFDQAPTPPTMKYLDFYSGFGAETGRVPTGLHAFAQSYLDGDMVLAPQGKRAPVVRAAAEIAAPTAAPAKGGEEKKDEL
jgi:hypothetical protein